MKKRFVQTLLFSACLLGSFPATARPEEDQNALRVAVYVRSGWEALGAGNHKKANELFRKAVGVAPKHLEALYGLGLASLYLDRHRKAELMFAKILTLDSENVNAMKGLGKLYSWEGRYEESITLYQMALKRDPENFDAQMGLAEVSLWAGYSKEAISHYEEILTLDPRNIKAYRGLAEVYLWDNRLKEAEEIYRKASEASPDNVQPYLGLGGVYRWQGLWSRAEEAYQKALEIEPDNREAQEGIQNLRRELAPGHQMIFKYLDEKDRNLQAETYITGYRHTRTLDAGNLFHAAYYFQEFQETAHADSAAHIVELGGVWHPMKGLTLLGAGDLRTYSEDPEFFAGVDVSTVAQYYQKNTLTLRYVRDLFDVLDEIRGNRYVAESNLSFGRFFLLTNAFSYTDYSDGNASRDGYNNLTFLLLKKRPDFNVGLGYRNRDFDNTTSLYYSPQDLESWILSAYLGRSWKRYGTYTLFKYMNNSDEIDNYYYVLGGEYGMSDTASLRGEISFFENTDKYQALATTLSCHLKF